MPPLGPASERELRHKRKIECFGYQRADGLWDIEAHLSDTKTYDLVEAHATRAAGEFIHDMWLRVTIDQNRTIRSVEAAMDATPYSVCTNATARFSCLEGLTIGPGWTREVRKRVGGALGCTHLVELLGPVATTAYQTLFGHQKARRSDLTGHKLLDTCVALASDSEVVRVRWPHLYVKRSH